MVSHAPARYSAGAGLVELPGGRGPWRGAQVVASRPDRGDVVSVAEPITRPHGGKHYRGRNKADDRYNYEQLRAWQALDLDAKITWAHERIETALAQLKTPCLAFSAGIGPQRARRRRGGEAIR